MGVAGPEKPQPNCQWMGKMMENPKEERGSVSSRDRKEWRRRRACIMRGGCRGMREAGKERGERVWEKRCWEKVGERRC